ncbi:class I SAM-dependent methyltransferase [Laribacter hongkongensis]|uniref:class I SAM-dependent methyltransferase n=1 Tax=Laribacter hongkongensis TaxID=168471 RepID=UPI001EFE6F59|nr:class I SAM-dependent methyltransferase [Laribacter hongkongensis]MCG8992291.1 class I SAM-dependent methyltransferase [Laribacter hongkongensis]MCG8999050.1 class I SAM-dependent methyltransferase [Laribacter hongkongensis]MCG9001735.1 class I SAM-dependent methyltransferase [Laribacter hongkongensis]MCG9004987.1 class I SAM-dependent methyltransferase [Laribacter hongkongensis]MCG9007207.1 class I SAM-dependent methyltransferase [Laribacter hongkongensis]
MIEIKRVNFDEYADQYESLLQGQLAFFSKDRGYFSEYKVALAKELSPVSPKRVLDFGCGIGLSLPFLTQYFPAANIFATDLSERSLAHVEQCFPNVIIHRNEVLESNGYDVIFVSGVFHHVPTGQKETVMRRLEGLLAVGGRLFVFEHNPFNPVTRRMVATCPFDEDAELISCHNMKRLVREAGGLQVIAAGYCLFFPQSLSGLRPLEKFLRWLPGGGQYFVVGGK